MKKIIISVLMLGALFFPVIAKKTSDSNGNNQRVVRDLGNEIRGAHRVSVVTLRRIRTSRGYTIEIRRERLTGDMILHLNGQPITRAGIFRMLNPER